MQQPWDNSIDPTMMGLLGQFQLSDADRTEANSQAMLAFGLSLLGTRKGQQMARLGAAGMNALNARNGSLASASQGKRQSMQDASNALQLQQQMQANRDDQATREVMRGLYGDSQQPTNIDMAGGGPPPAAMPTASSAPATASAGATLPGNPLGKYNQYMKVAEQLYARGAVKSAQEMEKKAKDFLPKLKEQKTLTQNGRRVTVNIYDDGTYQVLPDVSPDQEKAHFLDTGSQIGAVDPFTGKPVAGGGLYNKTMTPGEVRQGDQWAADHQLRVNADRRAAASAGAGGGKPQLVNGQWVYPPDAANPTGRAVTPTGLSAGEGKPLAESQAKATAFANQMFNASQTINELAQGGFDGKSSVQQGAIVSAGTEGIPFVPGSAAIPRAAAGKDAQRFYQAELQWTEGALRFMTGANAPKEEVIRNAATYFPRPGDSAAVIEQKAAARRNMEQSVRLAAGNGNNQLPSLPGSAPAAKTVVQTGTEKGTGRKVVKYSDGTVGYHQ